MPRAAVISMCAVASLERATSIDRSVRRRSGVGPTIGRASVGRRFAKSSLNTPINHIVFNVAFIRSMLHRKIILPSRSTLLYVHKLSDRCVRA